MQEPLEVAYIVYVNTPLLAFQLAFYFQKNIIRFGIALKYQKRIQHKYAYFF